MQLSIILMAVMASFAFARALPDPTPQGYTGPCSDTNCGAKGDNCYKKGCVSWPSLGAPKGCTCSAM
ncbi:hypothetical protein EJ04DRAFT_445476 [Polyplosphaeria fusca]|uniref:Uncharacterized protein n=1 Tax=Polyplosphaeria fusca TaxID=682080 RepID=A0A9P4QSE8_9PLEO|nr:hypothetical protein EJ04DRAFT_445476 [Polyplosphaeria fusca]